MTKLFVFVITLVVLTALVASECKMKEKKLLKFVSKYNDCLDKGFTSTVGCSSNDMTPSKKVKRKCAKIEKKLKKCRYKCI